MLIPEVFEELANAVSDLVVVLKRIASKRQQRGKLDRQPLSHARLLETSQQAIRNAIASWPTETARQELHALTYEFMGLTKNLDSQTYPEEEQPPVDQGIAMIASICARIVRLEKR